MPKVVGSSPPAGEEGGLSGPDSPLPLSKKASVVRGGPAPAEIRDDRPSHEAGCAGPGEQQVACFASMTSMTEGVRSVTSQRYQHPVYYSRQITCPVISPANFASQNQVTAGPPATLTSEGDLNSGPWQSATTFPPVPCPSMAKMPSGSAFNMTAVAVTNQPSFPITSTGSDTTAIPQQATDATVSFPQFRNHPQYSAFRQQSSPVVGGKELAVLTTYHGVKPTAITPARASTTPAAQRAVPRSGPQSFPTSASQFVLEADELDPNNRYFLKYMPVLMALPKASATLKEGETFVAGTTTPPGTNTFYYEYPKQAQQQAPAPPTVLYAEPDYYDAAHSSPRIVYTPAPPPPQPTHAAIPMSPRKIFFQQAPPPAPPPPRTYTYRTVPRRAYTPDFYNAYEPLPYSPRYRPTRKTNNSFIDCVNEFLDGLCLEPTPAPREWIPPPPPPTQQTGFWCVDRTNSIIDSVTGANEVELLPPPPPPRQRGSPACEGLFSDCLSPKRPMSYHAYCPECDAGRCRHCGRPTPPPPPPRRSLLC